MIIKAQLSKNGKYEIKLTGRCMDPLLKSGDKAEVISCGKLKTGSIYLFKMGDGTFAVHRLIKNNGRHLMMKGDRTKRYEVIEKADIIGEVRRVKLEDNGAWHEMNRYSLTGYIAAMLSRQSMFDKTTTSVRKFISEICIRINIRYGILRRKKWQQNRNWILSGRMP